MWCTDVTCQFQTFKDTLIIKKLNLTSPNDLPFDVVNYFTINQGITKLYNYITYNCVGYKLGQCTTKTNYPIRSVKRTFTEFQYMHISDLGSQYHISLVQWIRNFGKVKYELQSWQIPSHLSNENEKDLQRLKNKLFSIRKTNRNYK